MALSDLAVRQSKATGKPFTLPDSDGLSLAVTPAGSKTWHFRYYWLGKQKRMSLGSYPEVSLRRARTLRDEARALVAKDANPYQYAFGKGESEIGAVTNPSHSLHAALRSAALQAPKSRK